MTLTVLIYVGYGWDSLASITIPSFEAYCERHGYRLRTMLNDYYHDATWACPWQKLKWVIGYMRHDDQSNFFWIADLDILITNQTIPILKFTDDLNDLFMCKDMNGLNCGSYLIRNCKESLKWMEAVLALKDKSTSEQHAMQMLDDIPEFHAMMKVLPHPSINSVGYNHYPDFPETKHEQGQWMAGDLLLHLPGKTPEDRVAIFTGYQEGVLR